MKLNSEVYWVNEIAISKDGARVYADLEKGHAATHFADDIHLINLVKRVLQTKELQASDLKFEHVFDRVIGECDLQIVSEDDEIVYAVRTQRDRYTKFVKNKPRHHCSSVTIILKKTSEGYELISAWIGHLVPSFPRLHSSAGQDLLEKEFWATHALVWGRQSIDEGTITAECPWRD